MWAMVRSTTWRILLMLLLASFAVSLSSPLGGFLCGVIIPLPTYPLSAIHPEGSIPSSSPEGAWGGHVVHGPRIRKVIQRASACISGNRYYDGPFP